MQKYIAVVNPRMDNDDISRLIAQDVAGALFSISHQNYPVAARLIAQIKGLSRKHNHPVSIIQDISGMTDDLDLRFGLSSGVDWVATSDPGHLKVVKGLDKLAGLIFKGRNLPKGVRVDSVMGESFLDPDATIVGQKDGQIKHIISEHPDQQILDSLIDIAGEAGGSAIVVSDLGLAKNLSWRRTGKKIIFVPEKEREARQAAILRDVHPVFAGQNFYADLKNRGLLVKGDRFVDARDRRHVAINFVS